MIAQLWTNKIIDGEREFSQVPRGLKEDVRNLLISKGMENLIKE